MAEDEESDIAICFVDENDQREISETEIKKESPFLSCIELTVLQPHTNYLWNRVCMGDAFSVPFILSWLVCTNLAGPQSTFLGMRLHLHCSPFLKDTLSLCFFNIQSNANHLS